MDRLPTTDLQLLIAILDKALPGDQLTARQRAEMAPVSEGACSRVYCKEKALDGRQLCLKCGERSRQGWRNQEKRTWMVRKARRAWRRDLIAAALGPTAEKA